MNRISAWGILLIILTFSGCGFKKTDSQIHERYASLIGMELKLPDTGKIVYQNVFSDSLHTPPQKYTIVTHIDGSCVKCIADFEKWKSIFEWRDLTDELSFEIYLYTNNLDFFMEYYYDRLEIPHIPIRIDTLDAFITANNLSRSDNRNFKTFLVDQNDNIVLIGDPSQFPSIKKYYAQAIGLTDVMP